MPRDDNASHVCLNIAIDGPAGAGKSTIARRIAAIMDAVYIDTGAMYRACALKALRNGLPMSDEARIARMMENTSVEFRPHNGLQRVLLDGEDVTDFIRSPEVTKGSSDIARSAAVRSRLVILQRAIAREPAEDQTTSVSLRTSRMLTRAPNPGDRPGAGLPGLGLLLGGRASV